jgi:Leu/Phe-tRNA-protein transferase
MLIWLKNAQKHLQKTEWSYWYHLKHSFKQSNRLIATAVRSYIHGIFPWWHQDDGPITIFKMYREIKRIKHIKKLEKQLKDD